VWYLKSGIPVQIPTTQVIKFIMGRRKSLLFFYRKREGKINNPAFADKKARAQKAWALG